MCSLLTQSTHSNSSSRDGSIYLVTLITVAAIVTMVLVGMRLRTASNSQSALIEAMAESNTGILDLTEYALQLITDDPAWLDDAQKGVVFPDTMSIGDNTFSGTVIDTDTMAMPTPASSNFRMRLTATRGTVSTKAEVDFIRGKGDYEAFVDDLGARMYWRMDESTGDSVAIDTLNGNNGTYHDPSVVGKATNDEGAQVPLFDARNDHIEVPYDGDFKHGKGTFSLWMKSPGVSGLTSYGILGMQYKSGGAPALFLTIYADELYAFVDDSGSYSRSNEAGPSKSKITRNTWQHVALTWGGDGLTIYLDGVQVAKNAGNTSGTGSERRDRGGEQPLKIGAANVSFLFSYPEVEFKGSIAHVVYFRDKQLSADQISSLASVKPDLNTLSVVEGTWVRVIE